MSKNRATREAADASAASVTTVRKYRWLARAHRRFARLVRPKCLQHRKPPSPWQGGGSARTGYPFQDGSRGGRVQRASWAAEADNRCV